MKITNKHNLPDPIVRAITNDPYDAGDADISVTRLIAPPQIRALEVRHKDDITEDAADRIWSLVGQIGHTIIERAAIEELSERRLFAEAEGWRLSGQIDLLRSDDGKSYAMHDWKFTSVWAVIHGLKPEWESQLNVYRWLCRHQPEPIPVHSLTIGAVIRDWSVHKAKEGGSYPPAQFKMLEVPVWPDDEADAYVSGRVRAHQAAMVLADNELPECTLEERWQDPDRFAVKKPKNKRATKLYDHEDEAIAHCAKDPALVVEARPGTPKRCEDYCSVAKFCHQYQPV